MANRLVWALLWVPLSAVAQQDSSTVATRHKDHRFTVEAQGTYDSNVLYNDLIMGLYRGGELSATVRNHAMGHLGSSNRGGYLLGAKATYAWGDSLFGKPDWMPRVSITHQSAMGMRFSKDAYAVSFFGNAPFEGKSAQLGPGEFVQINYQALSLGVENKRTGSYLELSFVNGQQLNTAHVTTADLYTATDGRYLALRANGVYQRAGTPGVLSGNGIGAAINACWRTSLQLLGAQATVAVTVQDFGFVAWNGRTQELRKDTTIRYEGIRITDILHLDGLVVNSTILQDSVGLALQDKAFLSLLPANLMGEIAFGRLRKPLMAGGSTAYVLRMDQYMLPGYVPHATLNRNFVIHRRLAAALGAGYGGFGGLRAMVGLDATIGNCMRIGLCTPNLIGLCSIQAQGKAIVGRLEVAW